MDYVIVLLGALILTAVLHRLLPGARELRGEFPPRLLDQRNLMLGKMVLNEAGAELEMVGEASWRSSAPDAKFAPTFVVSAPPSGRLRGSVSASAQLSTGGPTVRIWFCEGADLTLSRCVVHFDACALEGRVRDVLNPFFPESRVINRLKRFHVKPLALEVPADGQLLITAAFDAGDESTNVTTDLVAFTEVCREVFAALDWAFTSHAAALLYGWRALPPKQRSAAVRHMLQQHWDDPDVQSFAVSAVDAANPRMVGAVYRAQPAFVEQRVDAQLRQKILDQLVDSGNHTPAMTLAPLLSVGDLESPKRPLHLLAVFVREWIWLGRTGLEEAIFVVLRDGGATQAELTLRRIASTESAEGLRALARLVEEQETKWYRSRRVVAAGLDALTRAGAGNRSLHTELAARLGADDAGHAELGRGGRGHVARRGEVRSLCASECWAAPVRAGPRTDHLGRGAVLGDARGHRACIDSHSAAYRESSRCRSTDDRRGRRRQPLVGARRTGQALGSGGLRVVGRVFRVGIRPRPRRDLRRLRTRGPSLHVGGPTEAV